LINAQFANEIIDSCDTRSDTLYYSSQYCNILIYSHNKCVACCFEGQGYNWVYGKGLGEVYYDYSYAAESAGYTNSLFYFKKDTLVCGTPDTLTQTPVSILVFEKLKQNILVFPNPATGDMQIQTDVPIKEIEITDITGRLLYTTIAKIIDCSGFANGVYFIKATTEKGVMVKKFIKE
jgi:hypothetical protein